MKKAKIVIEYKGERWRVSNSWRCASKRDCDLFDRGVCDCDGEVETLPCDAIMQAFKDIGCSYPSCGFKREEK